MKVLYICSANIASYSENSNAYQQPYNLCKNSSCTIIAKKGALLNIEFEQLADKIFFFNTKPLNLLLGFKSDIQSFYKQNLTAENYDVIISDFTEWSVNVAKFISKKMNLPWFTILWDPPFLNRYELHTGLIHRIEHYIRLKLYNNTVKRSIVFCFINSGLLSAEGLKFKNAFKLINGVDTKVTRKVMEDTSGKNKYALCNIGRVRVDKGCMEILKAFINIASEFKDSTLTFIGQIDGPNEEQRLIEDFIANHPYKSRIFVTNRISFLDAMHIVSKCEIGLHAYSAAPYLYYNHLLKIGEYQALGVVPVSVKYPGTLDMIKDKETGYFIKSNDYKKITNAVRDLFIDRELLEAISLKAIVEVESRNWDIVTKKMVNIIAKEINHD